MNARARMTRIPLAVALIATATVTAAQARPGSGRGPHAGMPPELSREMFPPELVMRHQEDIGLSEDQKSKLVRSMQEMQSDLVPLQFDMGEAAGKLRAVLARPRVDEGEAGPLADRLMTLETKIKRRHLSLMIQVKNVLTPEQQERLRALREQERASRRGRRGERPAPPEGDEAAPPEPEG